MQFILVCVIGMCFLVSHKFRFRFELIEVVVVVVVIVPLLNFVLFIATVRVKHVDRFHIFNSIFNRHFHFMFQDKHCR